MAAATNIEWCDSTFNPWLGCTKVSPACDDCYAARSTPARTLGVAWGPGQPRRRTAPDTWDAPRRWQRQAAAFQAQHGRRRRVFCASLADVFDNEVPAEWRADLFALISETPDLDWLLLTKRIGNVARMLTEIVHGADEGLSVLDMMQPDGGWYRNLWLGATVVNQAEADRDVPKLLATPAAVRFLSIEPMLGPISFDGLFADPRRINDSTNALEAIDWVICGGESGPKARPMHPDWARSLRDQCAAAGVAFFFKQWGQWGPDWEGAETCEACGRTKFDAINSRGECGHCGIEAWHAADRPLDKPRRIGKKAAGRLLDGRTHDAWPYDHQEAADANR